MSRVLVVLCCVQWEKLLVDMKRSRKTFDNSDTQRRFGPIQIDYGTVQSKVNNKYDQWHKAILTKFGTLVGETTGKLHQV